MSKGGPSDLKEADHPTLNNRPFHGVAAGQSGTVLAENKVSVCFYVVLKNDQRTVRPSGVDRLSYKFLRG
jgi:hypothetical protein